VKVIKIYKRHFVTQNSVNQIKKSTNKVRAKEKR